MSKGHLSDMELIHAIRRDDEWGMAELHERYWPVLFRLARKSMQSEDDAKDIVQEVFITLWDKRESISVTGSLPAYLYRMTLNRIIDNKRKFRYANEYTAYLTARSKEGVCATEHAVLERELRAGYEKSMQDIPKKARQVFELSREHGLSHQEISDLLHIGKGTVKSQINATLKVLRKRLTTLLFFL